MVFLNRHMCERGADESLYIIPTYQATMVYKAKQVFEKLKRLGKRGNDLLLKIFGNDNPEVTDMHLVHVPAAWMEDIHIEPFSL